PIRKKSRGLNRHRVLPWPIGPCHGPALRAVVLAPMIIPLIDAIVAHVRGDARIQFLREREAQPIGVHLEFDRQDDGFAGVADALKTTVANGGRLPAVETNHIEMAVFGMEAAAGSAGKELPAEIDRAALRRTVNLLAQNEQRFAAAVAQVEHAA